MPRNYGDNLDILPAFFYEKDDASSQIRALTALLVCV